MSNICVTYEVLVANVGIVHSGISERDATRAYALYAEQSRRETGRAAGEDVTLMRDNEPIKEHYGHLRDDFENVQDDEPIAE